jgi:hypothetical protein
MPLKHDVWLNRIEGGQLSRTENGGEGAPIAFIRGTR